MTTAHSTRAAVAASLLLSAVLITIGVLAMPDFSGGQEDRLTAIAAAPTAAALSTVSWIFGQLFMGLGMVGVAHLLRHRTPVLAGLAALFSGLNAFAHCVYGGVQLSMLSMAADPAALATHAAMLERLEAGVLGPFLLAALLGTVLGAILLGVALWRGGVGPRWVGPVLISWVLVEFAGSMLTQWAGYASGLLFVAAFGAMAVTVARSSLGQWRTAAEAEVRTPDVVTV